MYLTSHFIGNGWLILNAAIISPFKSNNLINPSIDVIIKNLESNYRYDRLNIYFFEALNRFICFNRGVYSVITIGIGSLMSTYSFAFLSGL